MTVGRELQEKNEASIDITRLHTNTKCNMFGRVVSRSKCNG